MPQIYYVGLLAGSNDVGGNGSADGREINRHNFTLDEIDQAMRRDVVQRLTRLIRLRNTHPAFEGVFAVEPGDDSMLRLRWQAGAESALLEVDLNGFGARATVSGDGGAKRLLVL